MMWQEGQNEEDDDNLPESFILCELHQTKIIRERWKYWSGTVPADVSVRLHRLESRLSVHEGKLINQITEKIPKINSSQTFIAEIQTYPYSIEPKQNIIIQGPDIQRIVKEKSRFYFWCCH